MTADLVSELLFAPITIGTEQSPFPAEMDKPIHEALLDALHLVLEVTVMFWVHEPASAENCLGVAVMVDGSSGLQLTKVAILMIASKTLENNDVGILGILILTIPEVIKSDNGTRNIYKLLLYHLFLPRNQDN